MCSESTERLQNHYRGLSQEKIPLRYVSQGVSLGNSMTFGLNSSEKRPEALQKWPGSWKQNRSPWMSVLSWTQESHWLSFWRETIDSGDHRPQHLVSQEIVHMRDTDWCPVERNQSPGNLTFNIRHIKQVLIWASLCLLDLPGPNKLHQTLS